jgi:hypothetical protein
MSRTLTPEELGKIHEKAAALGDHLIGLGRDYIGAMRGQAGETDGDEARFRTRLAQIAVFCIESGLFD